jgi:hypothetical protein
VGFSRVSDDEESILASRKSRMIGLWIVQL